MENGATRADGYVRLLGSTRARILDLVRRSDRTVGELAEALSITGNAVRDHLAVLGRERLVERSGVRRDTGGKPAHLYALSPAGERLFPKAYATVLGGVLDSLARRLDEDELEALLDEVGRRLAPAGEATESPALRERVDTAAEVLDGLGGTTRVEEEDGVLFIRSRSCPLDALVSDHPEICAVAEALVEAIVGREVSECCDREVPRCAFRISSRALGERA